jgi:hypothetical protein
MVSADDTSIALKDQGIPEAYEGIVDAYNGENSPLRLF